MLNSGYTFVLKLERNDTVIKFQHRSYRGDKDRGGKEGLILKRNTNGNWAYRGIEVQPASVGVHQGQNRDEKIDEIMSELLD